MSLTDLLTGACDQRLDASVNLMFKSVGSGLQDIVRGLQLAGLTPTDDPDEAFYVGRLPM